MMRKPFLGSLVQNSDLPLFPTMKLFKILHKYDSVVFFKPKMTKIYISALFRGHILFI